MKKVKILSILVSAIMVVSLLSACGGGNAGSDMEEDLGGKLAEGLTGADIDSGDKWPEQMPDKVPEITDGTITNSSAIMVGGKINASVGVEDLTEDEFNDYLSEIEAAGFNLIVSSTSSGIDTRTYGMGENALSLQYASKSGELIISYTGE